MRNFPNKAHAIDLPCSAGLPNEDRFCVSGHSARQRQGRTSPDDIDRCDRSPQCLFDGASKNLELIIAREDKSWYDEHSLSYQRSIGEMDDDEGKRKINRER